MFIQKLYGIYFSPTDTTKSVLKHMLAESDIPWQEIDLTTYEHRNCSYTFNEDDLVFLGAPVYGGRVPSAAENRIKLLKGGGTPIVLVATYGSMHYSHALFELQQIVTANGFITIAAAAVAAEHNVVSKIGSGKPNAQDLFEISSFVKHIHAKATSLASFKNLVLKGNMPISPRDIMPAKPHGDKNCTKCGACVKLCPMRAIDNPRKTAGKVCIRCMRCVKYCPQKARTFGGLKLIGVTILLTLINRGKEKQSDFFI